MNIGDLFPLSRETQLVVSEKLRKMKSMEALQGDKFEKVRVQIQIVNEKVMKGEMFNEK